jgi:hypothetical protein
MRTLKALTAFALFALVATIATVPAKAQYNPSSNPPALTLYVGQTTTLSVEGYNPQGYNPFLLDLPYRCVSTQWMGWNSLINSNVLTVSKTNSTVTLTAKATGTTQVSAIYQVSDCFGNQTDLNATINVTVVADNSYQSINGDSLLYYIPFAPTN